MKSQKRHFAMPLTLVMAGVLNERFKASYVIADWVDFYNRRRPHQLLGIKIPAEAFALAA